MTERRELTTILIIVALCGTVLIANLVYGPRGERQACEVGR